MTNLREPARGAHDTIREQLGPVRAALLAEARAESDQLVGEAEQESAAVLADAEAEIADAVQRATDRRRASARAHAAQEIARAESESRRRVLEAKEAVRRRFVDALHREAFGMRADPRYPALLDELEDLARRQLGPGTTIQRDPPGAGGVIGTAGRRRVDYSLTALSDRAVAAVADEVAQLWR